MQNSLKTELITLLDLANRGYSHPDAVVLALEAAQGEICLYTGFEPHKIFSLENTYLQCLSTDPGANINDQDGHTLCNNILQYTAQNRIADRIVQFNFHSGDNMVTTSTYEYCQISVGAYTVPCFSVAALFLENRPILSVIFARII